MQGAVDRIIEIILSLIAGTDFVFAIVLGVLTPLTVTGLFKLVDTFLKKEDADTFYKYFSIFATVLFFLAMYRIYKLF